MNEIYNQLHQLALQGRFSKFAQYYFSCRAEEINKLKLDDICLSLTDNGNLCGYGLACYLNLINENLSWHSKIFHMLQFHVQYIYGAYQATLSHVMRKIELSPETEDFYLSIFFVDITPEGELPEGEIFEISKYILSKWPNNETAQQVFDVDKLSPPQISVAEKIAHAIALDKKAAFKDLILRGRYIETRQILPMLTDSEIEQLIFEIAEREHNVCSYDYVWFWMREKGEIAQRHSFLAKVTSEAFKYDQKTYWEDLPGTKELIFFHTYRAAELEPNNLELQEKLLSLYEPGNESFDLEETKKLVEHVLKINPESEQGLRVQKLLF